MGELAVWAAFLRGERAALAATTIDTITTTPQEPPVWRQEARGSYNLKALCGDKEIDVNWMMNKFNLDLSLVARLKEKHTEEQSTSQARPSSMH